LKSLHEYGIAETYNELGKSQVAYISRFDDAYSFRNRIGEEYEKEAAGIIGETSGRPKKEGRTAANVMAANPNQPDLFSQTPA
jgi:hypothetical protein